MPGPSGYAFSPSLGYIRYWSLARVFFTSNKPSLESPVSSSKPGEKILFITFLSRENVLSPAPPEAWSCYWQEMSCFPLPGRSSGRGCELGAAPGRTRSRRNRFQEGSRVVCSKPLTASVNLGVDCKMEP